MYENLKTQNIDNIADFIDLRSDTVTKPDAQLREVMAAADVGDDVYGDDPNVNALQDEMAQKLGKEAGIFLPSSTQSNLVAMLTHNPRGREIVVGRKYHIFKYEAGGAAVLGGLTYDPLPVQEDGGLNAEDIHAAIKPNDSHFPISTTLVLENTHSGQAVSMERTIAAADAGRAHNMNIHLDGARMFNACVKLGVDAPTMAAPFDSINICLSKGLGAPVGAVLVGSKDFIHQAKRWRKMLGGGMRQAGIIAAAGRFALHNYVDDLAEDHRRTKHLADALRETGRYDVTYQDNQTNMLFVHLEKDRAKKLGAHMRDNKIIVSAGTESRIVLHRNIDDNQLDQIISAFKSFNG
ncbi:low-specificity L-threonine aldolase [Maritalea myrionectae]|uniref:low-specificity L-threonine aldolase n=1 Tax=Maritalea myrionectae TaxID=454601 RepID=UPI0004200099|nr:low-specificity L-threonine aldolase [Maritalea myrionectae]